MDNATNNDTLMAALSSGMLLPYYYATPLLLCYSLTFMLLPHYYATPLLLYYTNYSTKHYPTIIMPLNIEYAALVISLTL